MSEQQKQAPELEQTSEQQSLTRLLQNLQLPTEVISNIMEIKGNDRKDCINSLRDIQTESLDGKIGLSDASDKAKNTLIEYGIVIDNEGKDGKKPEINTRKEGLEVVNNNTEYNERLLKLSEDLNAVKSLDPAIVDIELEKAKQANPTLPPELTKTIADKTGVSIQNINDVSTKGGERQRDIANMIDAYYLSNPKLEESIKKAIQTKEPSRQFGKEFDELRNSARHLDIPVYETAKNVEKLIPDQSDKTQKAVVDTVSSLTRDNPNTLITRTGDKLNWEGINGQKYEIDMAVRPPRLTKSRNGLSISYEKPLDNPELEAAQQSFRTAQGTLTETKTTAQSTLRHAGLYEINLDKYSTEQLEKAFSGGELEQYEQRLGLAITTAEQISLQTEIREKMKNLSHGGSEGFLTQVGYQYIDAILTQRIEISEAGGMEFRPSRDEEVLIGRLQSLRNIRTNGEIEKYTTARKNLETKQAKLSSIRTPGVEDFDREATDTLDTLISLGFDELGQKNFNELVEAMNLRNKGTITPIETNKTPGLEENQKRSLRELALSLRERSGQGELRIALQQLAQGLRHESFRVQYWNTPEKRAEFLYRKLETSSESLSTP